MARELVGPLICASYIARSAPGARPAAATPAVQPPCQHTRHLSDHFRASTRPMFALSNLIPYLTPSEKKHSYFVSEKLSNLIYKIDTDLHQDIPQHRYLRDGHGYGTVWEAYLAITATIYAFNILKQNPVRYMSPYHFQAVIDYDDTQLYAEAMKPNTADLDLTKSAMGANLEGGDPEFFRVQPLQPSATAPARKRHRD